MGGLRPVAPSLLHLVSCRRSVVRQREGAGRCVRLHRPRLAGTLHEATGNGLGNKNPGCLGQVSTGQPNVWYGRLIGSGGRDRPDRQTLLEPPFVTARTPHRPSSGPETTTPYPPDQRRNDRLLTTKSPGDEAIPSPWVRDRGGGAKALLARQHPLSFCNGGGLTSSCSGLVPVAP